MMSDDILDLSIAITDKLVELGLIKDCENTDELAEWDVQDAIERVITEFTERL